MNLHEYQAKALFRDAGVPVATGQVAETVQAVEQLAGKLGDGPWVVKAQVHAGGRGQAGGVKVVEELASLRSVVDEMIGATLSTKQTAGTDLPIDRVLIEQTVQIDRELYLSVLVDRDSERVAFVASAAGGMNIEDVAEQTPEKVVTVRVHPATGVLSHHLRALAEALELDRDQSKQLAGIVRALYRLLLDTDARLIEINPLAILTDGSLMALDAKFDIDGNALYRRPELAALRDVRQEDATEAAAREHNLSYVTLDGNIGCMVNGAGLAMATLDLIQQEGGQPANFLDVGGNTTAERVATAFKLILAEDRVKAILVNIFGGIVRCDLIAQGIIDAAHEVDLHVPLVVRLAGNNAQAGSALLRNSDLNVITASGFADAAHQAVKAVEAAA